MAITSARGIVNLKDMGRFEHEDKMLEKYTLGDEVTEKLNGLRLIPRTMAKPSYSLKHITAADEDLVLDFCRRFFFRDEPMNESVKLLEGPHDRCPELEAYTISSLCQNVSLGAVDDHGELVGLIVNGIARRQDSENDSDKSADQCPDPKFRRILKVLSHLDQEAKVWKHLPKSCNAMLELRIASTHSAWRGRGLMKFLVDESEKLAKSLNISAIRMDATSAFSAAISERMHFQCIYRVKYADIADAPQPSPPHTEARVYIKEI